MYNKLFNDDIVVIYHGGCADGTCAAWVFRYAMSLVGYKTPIQYHPGYHDKQNVPIVDNRTVIMLDFTYKTELMQQIIAKSFCTVVLDHHETAKSRLEFAGVDLTNSNGFSAGKLHGVLDMERSGCQITWDVFINTPRPWFVDYIGDRDLWLWKLPNSRDVTSVLYSLYNTEDMDTYDMLLSNYKKPTDLASPDIIDTCKKYEQKIINNLKKTAILGTFECFKVFLVNCPSMFVSELGNQLANDDRCDFALLYTFIPPNEEKKEDEYIQISLRGSEHRNIDLSKIAEKFGGGGHRLACGFRWNGQFRDLLQMV